MWFHRNAWLSGRHVDQFVKPEDSLEMHYALYSLVSLFDSDEKHMFVWIILRVLMCSFIGVWLLYVILQLFAQ